LAEHEVDGLELGVAEQLLDALIATSAGQLAAAGRPGDRDELAFVHGRAHVAQRLGPGPGVLVAQTGDLKQGGGP
jgi:hypothetical protein